MNDDLQQRKNPDPALETSALETSDSMPPPDPMATDEETLLGSAAETPDDFDQLIRSAAILLKKLPTTSEASAVEDSLRRITNIDAIQSLSVCLDDEDFPSLPQTLGALTLLECLGEGGMGRVYRAVNPRLGRTQAVKILHSHRLSNAESLARFHQEIAALGRLNHPNIVAAHHADEQDGIPYLVMEYIAGASLSQVMQSLRGDGRHLSVEAAVNLVTQAATGMRYAHEQGVLHRDLKPSNLLVDRQGIVRVSDLGLARLAPTEKIDCDSSKADELTTHGEVMGTLGFMSPEQLRDSKSIDARADVYALGATLFFLLTGRAVYPTNSASIVSRIAATLSDPIPSIRSIRPDVPKELDRVLTRALAKNTNERIGSMQELIDLLSPWSGAPPVAELWNARKQAVFKPVDMVRPPARPLKISGERPPRWALILVGLGCFGVVALLTGFILRLALPGEGTLVIESTDPNIAVSVRQVDGTVVESMEVSQGKNEPLKLRAGAWEVSISGAEATQFRISPNRVEIGRNTPTTVTVERKANSPTPSTAANGLKPIPSTTQRSEAIDPLAVPVHAQEQSWKPGPLNRSRDGLVAQPAQLDELFGWQARLLRPASGSLQIPEHASACDVDPQGELVAWTTFDHAVVADKMTGRIAQVFIPKNMDLGGWQAIRFSPSGQKLALISQYGRNVEIRRRDGRLLSNWHNPHEFHPHLDWLANEEGILLSSETGLVILDLHGKVQSEWDTPPGSAKIRRGEMHRSSNGSVLFLTDDGRLQNWQPQDNVVRDVLAIAGWDPERVGDFIQHPDGTRILTPHSNSKPRTEMWDANGKLLAAIDGRLKDASWSPDRRSLIDSHRNIRDSETLAVVKQLALPAEDPLAASRLAPYWAADDEIVLLSQQSEEWRSEIGAIRRFHPIGRQLPTPNFPQPLGPLSATFHKDGSVSAYYGEASTQASLMHWDEHGVALKHRKTLPGPPEVHGVAWNLRDGRMLVPAGRMNTAMLSADGQVIRQFDGKQMHWPTWSPNGTSYTLNDHDERCIRLYMDGNAAPIWRSPSYGQVSQPSWSADGRWLAYSSRIETGTEHRIHVVDLNAPDRAIREFPVSDQHFAYPLQFSPDSKWIAACRSNPMAAELSHELLVIRLSDGKELRQIVAAGNRSPYIVWSDDSRNLFAAGHISIQADDNSLSYRPFANIDRSHLPSAFVGPNQWLNFELRGATIENFAGEVVERVGMSMRPVSAHTNSGQFQPRHQNRLLWLGGMYRQPFPLSSVNAIDLKTMEVDWTGVAFDDGGALSINGAGAILQSPEHVDRYLAHTIDYPGGRSVAVTRIELHRRAAATPDEKALLWANDLTAHLKGDDGKTISVDSSKVDELPNISSVQILDLSSIREISDRELVNLPRFISLKRLSVSATPVTTLPRLSELKQLEVLDLSQTMIRDLNFLAGHAGLRDLKLAQTDIGSSSATILGELPSLHSLDLSQTKLDRFALLELRKLKSLQHLNLTGVDLAEADIQQFREALPGCEVVSSLPTSKPQR